MTQAHRKIPAFVRWLALFISVFFILLGASMVFQEYAPGRLTRFGYVEALIGIKAKAYGAIVILVGCLPCLLLCRSARLATVLGTVLGTLLLAVLFASVYF